MIEIILISLIALAVALPLVGVGFTRPINIAFGVAILVFLVLWLIGARTVQLSSNYQKGVIQTSAASAAIVSPVSVAAEYVHANRI